MPLTIGTRLGPYEILSAIGSGGMGEVYRARDTKLNRDVALKILPEAFALDAERVARFQREAQVLASLNHPNIAAIYGFEESTSGQPPSQGFGEPGRSSKSVVRALVLELVEGPTLADVIARARGSERGSLLQTTAPSLGEVRQAVTALSPSERNARARAAGGGAPDAVIKAGPHGIPIDEALPIARQIADALEAAHEHGIMHRDLKPANIKVRPDGTVKVLDFGLAKALADETGGDPSNSPTTSMAATRAGVILGTAAYMSPEQARGKTVDKRTDIWAFGCVLYEMLAGNRAFEGDDVSDTLAGILRGEPDWTALSSTIPAPVRRLLHRCLEKDPKRRLRDIGDMSVLSEELAAVTAETAQAPIAPRSGHRERVAWALAAILAAAAIALAIPALRRVPTDRPSIRFSISPAPNVTPSLATGQVAPVLSPDGRRVAFVAARAGESNRVWVRSLDSLEAQPLPGTETATQPFWSPDNRTLGFFAAGGKLKTIDASGGPVQSLCDAPLSARGGTWSRDGVIVFGSLAGGLFKVAAAGGQATPLSKPDASRGENAHRFPSFLPDGRHFVYLAAPSNTIWLGSLDTKDSTRLVNAESQAQYAAPGYLLFARQGTLMAQPFDPRQTTVTGDAVPIAEQVAPDPSGSVAFSVSENGALAYRAGAAGLLAQLTWFDRAGKPIGPVGSPGPYRNPDLSPDGSRVAMEVSDAQSRTQDIWLLGLARGVVSRLTFDPRNDIFPVWSPDGSRIAFGSDREGGFNLYQKLSNGAAGEELLLKTNPEAGARPNSWSPDGRFLLYRDASSGGFNTGILPLVGDRKPRLFFPQATFSQLLAQVSPDGRWIAYNSNESGRFEVYVQSFPTPGGKWQISKDGGFYPRWRGDGKELFYYAVDGQLMRVPIAGESALESGAAVPLFKARMLFGSTTAVGFRAQYDVTRDGQRFLLNVPLEETQASTITVVVNWTAGLKK